MSSEKEMILNSLGATVIRTPYYINLEDPESAFAQAKKLSLEIKDAFIMDPYSDPANWKCHYDETAEEIWDQTEGKVDYVVLGDGTGGSITGIGRKLKEKKPSVKIHRSGSSRIFSFP